jgi:NADH dehydrogenase/NADH:ubiquinone oxidoreductase subunit G
MKKKSAAKSIVKKPERKAEPKCTEPQAKEYRSKLISAVKGHNVSKLELYESIYDCYMNRVWEQLGSSNFDAFINATFPNEQIGTTTIREALRVWKQMSTQLEDNHKDDEDELFKATKHALMDLFKASKGQIRKVSEATRLDIGKNLKTAVLDIASSNNFSDAKTRLRKHFKPINPNRAEAEAAKKGAEGAMISVTISMSAEEFDNYREAMEIASQVAGTPKPFAEMSSAEKGALTSVITADFISGAPDRIAKMTEPGKLAMMNVNVKNIMRMSYGEEPSQSLVKKVVGYLNDAMQRAKTDAEDPPARVSPTEKRADGKSVKPGKHVDKSPDDEDEDEVDPPEGSWDKSDEFNQDEDEA